MIGKRVAVCAAALLMFYPRTALAQQAERLAPETTAPNHASDTAFDQAPGSQVTVASAEPPDGRPATAHPGSAGIAGDGITAGEPREHPTGVEPPDGRTVEPRPIPGRPISPLIVPGPRAAPARSNGGTPKRPVADAKNANEANGREPVR